MFTKKLFMASLLAGSLLSLSSVAQSISGGTETIDKVPLPGLYLSLPVEEKIVAKAWESQLNGYGRVMGSRGVYRIGNANVSAVSSEPVNLVSQVKSAKKSSTIFLSLDLGSQNYVTSGTPQYAGAEQLLRDFAAKLNHEQEVRAAEDMLAESQKAQQNMVRKGEKLQRDIESNRKDKEKLLKRIDENAKELEQLTKDLETNKTDQANALSDVSAKIKNVEEKKKQ
jgi:hypothetical protein